MRVMQVQRPATASASIVVLACCPALAKITATDKILTNISHVLKGDFSSFNAVHDERVRPPQEAPGIINKAVAARISLALKENCIA